MTLSVYMPEIASLQPHLNPTTIIITCQKQVLQNTKRNFPKSQSNYIQNETKNYCIFPVHTVDCVGEYEDNRQCQWDV